MRPGQGIVGIKKEAGTRRESNCLLLNTTAQHENYLMDTSNSPGDSCLPLGERTQKLSCVTLYWSAIQTQAHNTAYGRQTANTQRYDFLHIHIAKSCLQLPPLLGPALDLCFMRERMHRFRKEVGAMDTRDEVRDSARGFPAPF